MAWISQRTAATALNVVPLPTDIHLAYINITPSLLPKVLHGQLAILHILWSVSFSANEREFGSTADDFYAELTRCKQLQQLFILSNNPKPSIRQMVY